MTLLRNLLYYPVFYIGSPILVLIAMPIMLVNAEAYRKWVRIWARFHHWCLKNLLGIHIEMEGGPIEGPALYVFKHESMLEALDLPRIFEYPAPFAKQEMFDLPGWGLVAERYGCVPVARNQGAKALRKMVAAARERSSQGRELVLFPEGTRIPHGTVAPLRPGFAGLYKLLHLPIVPVAVNSGPLYHRWIKQPGTITYKFGETIPPGLSRAEVEKKVEQALNALNS